MPAWSLGINPGAVPPVYAVSSNVTLPGGTYWFISLTISSGSLTFSGPSTVYINGTCALNGDLLAYNLRPSNLRIYQYGGNTFGDSGSNAVNVCADIWAPSCNFTMKNNGTFRGRCYFNSFNAKNNAQIYYDESFGPASGGIVHSLVQ